MAALADVQRRGFDARLKRIQRGGPNTAGTIYMGSADSDGKVIQPKRKRQRLGTGALRSLMMWPSALFLGAGAMLGGRAAAFHLTTQPDLVPPEYATLVVLFADIGVAATLLLLIAWGLGMGRGLRKLFLISGFVGMMVAEGLVIEQAPELFVPLFSENYVAAAISGTAPIETFEETLAQLSQSRLLLPMLPAASGG